MHAMQSLNAAQKVVIDQASTGAWPDPSSSTVSSCPSESEELDVGSPTACSPVSTAQPGSESYDAVTSSAAMGNDGRKDDDLLVRGTAVYLYPCQYHCDAYDGRVDVTSSTSCVESLPDLVTESSSSKSLVEDESSSEFSCAEFDTTMEGDYSVMVDAITEWRASHGYPPNMSFDTPFSPTFVEEVDSCVKGSRKGHTETSAKSFKLTGTDLPSHYSQIPCNVLDANCMNDDKDIVSVFTDIKLQDGKAASECWWKSATPGKQILPDLFSFADVQGKESERVKATCGPEYHLSIDASNGDRSHLVKGEGLRHDRKLSCHSDKNSSEMQRSASEKCTGLRMKLSRSNAHQHWSIVDFHPPPSPAEETTGLKELFDDASGLSFSTRRKQALYPPSWISDNSGHSNDTPLTEATVETSGEDGYDWELSERTSDREASRSSSQCWSNSAMKSPDYDSPTEGGVEYLSLDDSNSLASNTSVDTLDLVYCVVYIQHKYICALRERTQLIKSVFDLEESLYFAQKESERIRYRLWQHGYVLATDANSGFVGPEVCAHCCKSKPAAAEDTGEIDSLSVNAGSESTDATDIFADVMMQSSMAQRAYSQQEASVKSSSQESGYVTHWDQNGDYKYSQEGKVQEHYKSEPFSERHSALPDHFGELEDALKPGVPLTDWQRTARLDTIHSPKGSTNDAGHVSSQLPARYNNPEPEIMARHVSRPHHCTTDSRGMQTRDTRGSVCKDSDLADETLCQELNNASRVLRDVCSLLKGIHREHVEHHAQMQRLRCLYTKQLQAAIRLADLERSFRKLVEITT